MVATRFIIIDPLTCFTLYIVVLSPFCEAGGINPWILAMCTYIFCQPWFARYQNVNYLAGFASAGGDDKLDFAKSVRYCFAYNLVALTGVLISVPVLEAARLYKIAESARRRFLIILQVYKNKPPRSRRLVPYL